MKIRYRGGSWASLVLIGAALGAGVGACNRPAPPAPPPPPVVSVSLPLQREVIEWDEFIGRLAPVDTAEVRARVSGFVEAAPFDEGLLVQKGKVLFIIDPRPFQAELDHALAEAERVQAQLQLNATELRKTEKLLPSGAVGELELDTARANLKASEAAYAAARAAVRTAELNLEWTRVTAPIAGRVSSKFVTAGNLINGGAGESTLLTTITSVDPMYCYVDADEQRILKYRRLAREKKRISARDQPIPCFLQLSDETGFPREGYIDFVDNRLDPATGTLRARGVFPNKDGELTPGFFARLRVPGSGRYWALLVPDAAVGTDQGQKFLLIVNSDDVVQYRRVEIGSLFGTLRVIEQGLSATDRVITNGLQRARPGGKVQPTLAPIPPESFQQTAPGSPATQALPTTREAPAATPTGTPDSPPDLPAAAPAADTGDSSDRSVRPSTAPASRPAEGERGAD